MQRMFIYHTKSWLVEPRLLASQKETTFRLCFICGSNHRGNNFQTSIINCYDSRSRGFSSLLYCIEVRCYTGTTIFCYSMNFQHKTKHISPLLQFRHVLNFFFSFALRSRLVMEPLTVFDSVL